MNATEIVMGEMQSASRFQVRQLLQKAFVRRVNLDLHEQAADRVAMNASHALDAANAGTFHKGRSDG
jgi:hypothetical protein